MQKINIELLKEEEVEELSEVILEVFNEFVAGDFLEEGITLFKEFVSPPSLKTREESGEAFTLVAKDEDKIMGTISIKDKDHISLFFVSKSYHRQGIGKKLFKKALDKILLNEEKVSKVTVNASPYAVDVYKNLGFKVQGDGILKEENGIVYLPMEMIIKQK